MFTKNSRYFSLTNLQTFIPAGTQIRVVECKSLRLIPDRSGEFTHQVLQSDRPDILASKYYEDPTKWWLIADANPQWPLPTEMINSDPVARLSFSLKLNDAPLDEVWLALQRALATAAGILSFAIDRDAGEIDCLVNQAIMSAEEISELLQAAGFALLARPERRPQSATAIVIPPNDNP
ncbi:hypothetical protein KJ068_13545 [bacterium]|nr:hypothetical protein [bacterium]